MGLTPEQVGEMSVWQFAAVVDGWNNAQGGSRPAYPTDDDFDRAMAAEWGIN